MRTRGCCIDVGIPIPKTLVIWASPLTLTLTLTQIAEVIRGMPISLEFWESGCPKRGDAHITVTEGLSQFHISPMFPRALRLRLFSGTQQFNSISDSRVACSRLSDSGGRRERKRHAKSWRGGKKEKERSCRAFSTQFPPVLFLCLRFLNSADPTISEPGTG